MTTIRLAALTALLLSPVLAADGDWPYWRGPQSDGNARGDAPLRWSDTENIAWKADIPGRGHSSPVIWGDRIFLTTAIRVGPEPAAPPPPPPPPAGAQGPGSGGPGGPGRRGPGGPGGFPGFGGGGPQAEHQFVVMALDRKSGKLLWQKTVKTATPHEGFHRQYGSFASNSPVTDGKLLYAFFGSRGLYCLDLDGRPIWEKDFGVAMKMRLGFGEGMAPVLDGDRLIVVFDQEGGSFMVTLDKATGKEIWRVNRDEGTNWAAPLVVTHGGRKQIVVSATSKVRGYDYDSGKLLWEAGGLGANTIPAPVAHNGMVIAMSGYRNPNLLAIKLGREGDLTGTDAIAWTNVKGNSYTPSPVLHGGKLYMLTDNGQLSCLNAATGEPHYLQTRLPKPYNFKSSPVAVNGKLYLASENEDVIVVKMGETFEVLATNTLKDQTFIATPAVAGGEIYLRGQNHLFCVRGAAASR